MDELVDITDVQLVGEYRLRLTFEDGTVGDVDFDGTEVAWSLRATARSCILRSR